MWWYRHTPGSFEGHDLTLLPVVMGQTVSLQHTCPDGQPASSTAPLHAAVAELMHLQGDGVVVEVVVVFVRVVVVAVVVFTTKHPSLSQMQLGIRWFVEY